MNNCHTHGPWIDGGGVCPVCTSNRIDFLEREHEEHERTVAALTKERNEARDKAEKYRQTVIMANNTT